MVCLLIACERTQAPAPAPVTPPPLPQPIDAAPLDAAPDAATYSPRRLRLDGNCELRINRSLSLYLNGRNLTNEALGNATYSSKSPAYSRMPTASVVCARKHSGKRTRLAIRR